MKLFRRRQRLLSPKQMFAEYPPGIREYLLRNLVPDLVFKDPKKSRAYDAEADRVFEVFAQRRTQATALEKAGNIDGAIELYEASVADRCYISHPYERLRVLYSKRRQYDEAIRACRAFIEMDDLFAETVPHYPDFSAKRKKFEEWIPKLEQKRERLLADS